MILPLHISCTTKTDRRVHRLPPSKTSSLACTRRTMCPQTWPCPR
jgi:hypothetical protein